MITDVRSFRASPVFEALFRWKVLPEGSEKNAVAKLDLSAKELGAKVIVMTNDGPDRFLDGLRGTTSERVLRKSHCPVAVIPIKSIVE